MNGEHHAMLFRTDSVCDLELPQTDASVESVSFYIERFGVGDARELVRRANNRPAVADSQLLVVRTNFITLEAQNALLKVLEEPLYSTRLAFVVPYDFIVLPTLISRFSEQSAVESVDGIKEFETFQSFLEQGYKDRLTSIEQSIKKQDTAWQRQMKQGLIKYLNENTLARAQSLEELELVARLLLTRGASNKFLLEHTALILPIR